MLFHPAGLIFIFILVSADDSVRAMLLRRKDQLFHHGLSHTVITVDEEDIFSRGRLHSEVPAGTASLALSLHHLNAVILRGVFPADLYAPVRTLTHGKDDLYVLIGLVYRRFDAFRKICLDHIYKKYYTDPVFHAAPLPVNVSISNNYTISSVILPFFIYQTTIY